MSPVYELIVRSTLALYAPSPFVTAGPLTSVEDAVIPTVEPLAAPSATVLVAALLSTGVDGATSVTAMLRVCELESVPRVLSAVTVQSWPAPPSQQILLASLTRMI